MQSLRDLDAAASYGYWTFARKFLDVIENKISAKEGIESSRGREGLDADLRLELVDLYEIATDEQTGWSQNVDGEDIVRKLKSLMDLLDESDDEW